MVKEKVIIEQCNAITSQISYIQALVFHRSPGNEMNKAIIIHRKITRVDKQREEKKNVKAYEENRQLTC